ncbi:MAG: hypothetical protein NTV80_24205, partial [Verrucomicrobia bacterium]|nr:hypothetical protein [Verrucomicrobiota bacterium]
GAGMAVSVMREGGMTAAGVPLASIQRMDANESGRCLVHATLQAPVTSNTALIRADTNNMMQQTVIARKGDMAPGVPNGVFSSFIGETYVGGNISFRATVTGQGITAANNEGLWYFKGNNNNLIVRTGDQVESMPTGILWSKILGAWMHEDSGIMVYGRIKGPGVAPANDTILWLVPEVPERVVLLREGDLIGGGSTYRLGPMQRIAFNPGGGYMVLASLLGAPAYSDTVLLSGETYDSLTDNPILRRPVLRMREGTLYDRQEGIVSKLTSITWSGPAFDPFQKAAHPHPMGTAATLQLGYSNGTKEIVWSVP